MVYDCPVASEAPIVSKPAYVLTVSGYSPVLWHYHHIDPHRISYLVGMTATAVSSEKDIELAFDALFQPGCSIVAD